MPKPAVILVGGDKGGVGKTTVARTLIDYFGTNQTPTRAFDTDSPRGTLKRFHPYVTKVVDVTSASDQMKIFDTLGSADAKVTVIDVRAGLLSPTLQALNDIGFLELVKKGQIAFAVFLILGPSITSLEEIAETPLRRRRQPFPGQEPHQRDPVFRVGPGDLQIIFQAHQGRPGDHHSKAQRDGLRAGGSGRRTLCLVRHQQECQRRGGR